MILFLVAVLLLISFLPRLWTALNAWPKLYSVANAPEQQVAIVFGAGLRRDGSPSPVLRDRVDTAAELYFSGKVEKLLMSGYTNRLNHNEPEAMQEYALRLGIPAEDIVLDYAGSRTYDTCYRARHIFKLKSAALVTQGFHLPRALYLCNNLGLPSIGVSADQRAYRQRVMLFWNLRETAATVVALWEVHVSRPIPALGEPEPIHSQEAQ
jgi:SanA protein